MTRSLICSQRAHHETAHDQQYWSRSTGPARLQEKLTAEKQKQQRWRRPGCRPHTLEVPIMHLDGLVHYSPPPPLWLSADIDPWQTDRCISVYWTQGHRSTCRFTDPSNRKLQCVGRADALLDEQHRPIRWAPETMHLSAIIQNWKNELCDQLLNEQTGSIRSQRSVKAAPLHWPLSVSDFRALTSGWK